MAKTVSTKTVPVELVCGRCTDRGTQSAGDVIDVPSDEAKRMIEAGHAKPYKADGVEVRG